MSAHRINGTVTQNVGSVEFNTRITNLTTRLTGAYRAHMASGVQREGQAWMNALRDVDPILYDIVTGTYADCFYDDGRIPAFKQDIFGF